MSTTIRALAGIAEAPDLTIDFDVPLREHTRFGIGGPADVLIDAATESAFSQAFTAVRSSGLPLMVIGGGTNLIVADAGYRGVILRYTANRISGDGERIYADAGAVLQDLVDYSIENGLAGIHTMTGIPGWVGGAVYGNAGAYGRAMYQNVAFVRFFDGDQIRVFTNAECEFSYRESTFKNHKNWILFSTELALTVGDRDDLRRQAREILELRNAKYPPSLKCAGSIFKNLILAELPESVRKQVPAEAVREGKVAAAFFLEAAGAKGMRNGDIHVADYHSNLIYNAGQGTAQQVCEVIDELKARVFRLFGFSVEEEVQYVGFGPERG
jgi:UDP-N-acetylmuramate dehydrogenase